VTNPSNPQILPPLGAPFSAGGIPFSPGDPTLWVPIPSSIAQALDLLITLSGGSTPGLDAVLNVANIAATKSILVAAAQAIDAALAAGVLNLGTVNAAAIGMGPAAGGLGAFQLFIDQGGIALHASNAGIQQSSTTADRAGMRNNQYGANTGVPGWTGFKSRGTNIGDLAKVIAGDVLAGITAIGVADDNASIGIASTIRVLVPAGGVPAGQNWVATDYELTLQPLGGPINGCKQAFYVTSEGILRVKESANCMAGVAVLDGTGTIVVGNTNVTATTKFNLTAQDGGNPPTGVIYQSARVVGTSFTIKSAAGAADTGVAVYYQLWEPTAP